jgi:catechol 2,3-dioxygenase-like lactoylglutathione lyase family enzyme
MGFHHVALATSDLQRTHRFYTEAMGFELAKVVVGGTPEGGWAKHAFYEAGDGSLIAFWELHGDYPEIPQGMSRGIGLPDWINHLAFRAHDDADLEAAKKRWADLGLDVFEVDHGFCRSIYTNDTNQTMVEFCLDTRPLDDTDRAEAAAAMADPSPPLESALGAEFYPGDPAKRPDWLS